MSGSCFCGAVKFNYTGDVQAKALCHCADCKKISGSAYSTNIIVPDEGFSVTGTPKTIPKKADSGNTITSYFCGDCGTTLFRESATFAGAKIVKAGVLDGPDALNGLQPALELYSSERVKWLNPVEGTEQKATMS